MTPAQFNALADRKQQSDADAREIDAYNTAVITSAINNLTIKLHNIHYKQPIKKVYQPWDIFPGYDWKPKPKGRKASTPEDQLEQVKIINRILGGDEK